MENELNGLFRGRNAKVVVPAILEVIKDMDEYLPLTVRQLFYLLVSREILPNNQKSYRVVSNVASTMRKNDMLPWDAIEDRSRRLIEKRGVTDLETHIEENASFLFGRYQRCLVQNQETYVEIFTEKDALSTIIENACWIYCTRVCVVRGQVSSTFVHQYADRARAAIKRGQRPVILYLGDLDPSGLAIPRSLVNRLSKDEGLDVELRRMGLTIEQVEQYNIPASVEAVKKTDPNYKRFIGYGYTVAAEVDALHPAVLRQTIEQSLGEILDTEDMIQQQAIERRERDKLKRLERMFAEDCRTMGIRYNSACRYLYQ